MPSDMTSAEPVRKSVTVAAAPRRAFELFTTSMHEWWPLATHSVGCEEAVSVTFGQGIGAAIVETLADGTTVVRLTHSGWERRPDGASARDNYESGWDPVVHAFAAAALRLLR